MAVKKSTIAFCPGVLGAVDSAALDGPACAGIGEGALGCSVVRYRRYHTDGRHTFVSGLGGGLDAQFRVALGGLLLCLVLYPVLLKIGIIEVLLEGAS